MRRAVFVVGVVLVVAIGSLAAFRVVQRARAEDCPRFVAIEDLHNGSFDGCGSSGSPYSDEQRDEWRREWERSCKVLLRSIGDESGWTLSKTIGDSCGLSSAPGDDVTTLVVPDGFVRDDEMSESSGPSGYGVLGIFRGPDPVDGEGSCSVMLYGAGPTFTVSASC